MLSDVNVSTDPYTVQVSLSLLHVTPTLGYNLRALETVLQLTALRELHLVTYRADPDDIDFA